jgi:hypothetical protein
MRVWGKISMFFFVVGLTQVAHSQTKDSYDYNSEFTWGINKNTSGGLIGGFTFKKARKLNEKLLETYGLEIMNVKHPQEVRRYANTGNPFIYGKSNYLYALRMQYGRDLIVFKKAPQQGVEIKIVTAVGPSIGILAPYYIQRSVDSQGSYFDTVNEQYDPNNPNDTYDNILGTGNLFEGIGESKIQLGANAKVGLNFELGTSRNQVTGFEVGFLVDAYMNKIILMPTTYNRAVFPTLYFTLFYGSRK